MKILSKIYKFLSSWTGTVIVVLFVILFVAQAFVIPSGSMRTTLLEGDFLFVKKFSYGIPTPHIPFVEWQVAPDSDGDGHIIRGEGPKRGDIVVFRYPLNEKMHFVKRNFAVSSRHVNCISRKAAKNMSKSRINLRAFTTTLMLETQC